MAHNYTTINSSVDFPNPSAPYIDKAFLQAILTELGNSSIDTAGEIPMTGALRQLFAGMIAQQGPLGGLGIRHYADVLPQQTGMVEWGIMFNVPLDFVTLPTPISVSSITRVGSVATATIPGNTFSNGDMITFAGANQPEYNGTFLIYGKSGSNVSYTVAGTPVTPATGTITATNSSTPWGGRDIAAPCAMIDMPENLNNFKIWYAPTGLAGTQPVWVNPLDFNLSTGQFNIPVVSDTYLQGTKGYRPSVVSASNNILVPATTMSNIIITHNYGYVINPSIWLNVGAALNVFFALTVNGVNSFTISIYNPLASPFTYNYGYSY